MKMINKENELYSELCNYDRIKRVAKKLSIELVEEEVLLMNFHNNLVWKSYRIYENPVTDAILFFLIKELMDKYGFDEEEIPIEFLGIMYSRKEDCCNGSKDIFL